MSTAQIEYLSELEELFGQHLPCDAAEGKKCDKEAVARLKIFCPCGEGRECFICAEHLAKIKVGCVWTCIFCGEVQPPVKEI